MSQRNICREDMNAALLWGTELWRCGALLVHLKRRDVQYAARVGNVNLKRSQGVVVIFSKNGRVKTVYRTSDHKRLKRMKKTRSPSRRNRASHQTFDSLRQDANAEQSELVGYAFMNHEFGC